MTFPTPTVDTQDTLKTYRYLRVSLIGLVLLIFVAVFREHAATRALGSCFQTSISAYYFTPAQAVFVSALVAIGVCLIAMKGNSETEDVLLNLAGMLAPVVAFVPTPPPDRQCWSVPRTDADTLPNVTNNVFALLLVGALALAWTGATVLAGSRDADGVRRHQWRHLIGLGVAALAYLAFGLWFRHPDPFRHGAHYTAAISMFVFFGGVVFANAYRRRYAGRPGSWLAKAVRLLAPAYFRIRSAYAAIGALMLWGAVAIVVAGRLTTWRHQVLWLEFAEIGLFAAFWVLETVEQWDESRRPRIALVPGPAGR